MPGRPLTDDPSIANDEVLLRRLQPDWIVPGNHGRMRIASAAFKHEETSILFYTLLQSQGRFVQDVLSGHPDNSLCSITVGLARDLGQGVVYDVGPPNDPAHGLVIGKKTKAVANRFAREAAWVIPSSPPSTGG
jgi:hypothetical protein